MACRECREEKIKKDMVFREGVDIAAGRVFHWNCQKCRAVYRIKVSDQDRMVIKITSVNLPRHEKIPDTHYLTYTQAS